MWRVEAGVRTRIPDDLTLPVTRSPLLGSQTRATETLSHTEISFGAVKSRDLTASNRAPLALLVLLSLVPPPHISDVCPHGMVEVRLKERGNGCYCRDKVSALSMTWPLMEWNVHKKAIYACVMREGKETPFCLITCEILSHHPIHSNPIYDPFLLLCGLCSISLFVMAQKSFVSFRPESGTFFGSFMACVRRLSDRLMEVVEDFGYR